jgi:hypothetical protein
MSENFENQKCFVTGFTKESLCIIRFFYSPTNIKMLSSGGVFIISEFCYHDIVVMTHTHLSMVLK